MVSLEWTSVIRKGIIKFRHAFDSNTSEKERVKIMKKYVQNLANSDIKIIDCQHYDDGSLLEAEIKPSK